jgi:hypothetical protein
MYSSNAFAGLKPILYGKVVLFSRCILSVMPDCIVWSSRGTASQRDINPDWNLMTIGSGIRGMPFIWTDRGDLSNAIGAQGIW